METCIRFCIFIVVLVLWGKSEEKVDNGIYFYCYSYLLLIHFSHYSKSIHFLLWKLYRVPRGPTSTRWGWGATMSSSSEHVYIYASTSTPLVASSKFSERRSSKHHFFCRHNDDVVLFIYFPESKDKHCGGELWHIEKCEFSQYSWKIRSSYFYGRIFLGFFRTLLGIAQLSHSVSFSIEISLFKIQTEWKIQFFCLFNFAAFLFSRELNESTYDRSL